MILQALNRYYERAENMPREGWVRRGVDYVLVLDKQGNCTNIELVGEQKKGKVVPREMLVPAIGKQAMKHTNSGNDANLLWDNASFVFGTGNKGGGKLNSFISTIRSWLGDIEDEGLTAITRFCARVKESPEFVTSLLERFQFTEDFGKRDPVLVFRLNSDVEHVHVRSAIRAAYEKSQVSMQANYTLRGNCLVTGERGVSLAQNESVIKGVWGGQPAGCNIVSFNARAFESYGKRDRNGENAPVSLQASFAYTTALNHLLGSKQRIQVGDTSTVFWAEEPHDLETTLPNLFGEAPKDNPGLGAEALRKLYAAIQTGHFAVGGTDTRFHVLGLAPNAARIAIRFWETATAIDLAKRLQRYFEDIRVVHADYEPEHLSLFRLLTGIALLNKADNIPPNLGGEVVRAILEGLPYPKRLLNLAVQRCRAEQKPTYARAAAIKACLNCFIRRNNTEGEYLPMLDPINPNPAYRLGRLFAVLEKIQEEASPGLNATIRDRYYGAASSTPATVFPLLLKLKNHHVSKLDERGKKMLYRAFSDNRPDDYIGQVLNDVPEIPSHLALQDQGRFALGYYHQRQAFFTKPDNSKGDTK